MRRLCGQAQGLVRRLELRLMQDEDRREEVTHDLRTPQEVALRFAVGLRKHNLDGDQEVAKCAQGWISVRGGVGRT